MSAAKSPSSSYMVYQRIKIKMGVVAIKKRGPRLSRPGNRPEDLPLLFSHIVLSCVRVEWRWFVLFLPLLLLPPAPVSRWGGDDVKMRVCMRVNHRKRKGGQAAEELSQQSQSPNPHHPRRREVLLSSAGPHAPPLLFSLSSCSHHFGIYFMHALVDIAIFNLYN